MNIQSFKRKLVYNKFSKWMFHLLMGYFLKLKPAFLGNIFGHKMYQNPADMGINYQSFNNYPEENFKYGEIACARSIKSNSIVLDIGANIGFFTLLYARAVGSSGKVYAFEPGPASFALLTTNVAINGYKNVMCINKAVAEIGKIAKIYLNRTGESDNRLFSNPKAQRERDSMDMEIVALDDYLGNVKIDFIKMDIQGSEFSALKGMKSIIKNNPQIKILLEYSPLCLEESGVNLKEFLQYLSSLNLSMNVLWEDKKMEVVTDQWLLNNCGIQKKFANLNLLLQNTE